MKYFKQETAYTCGCACFRMVLSEFDLPVPSEEEMISILGTIPESGTHYDSLVKVAEKYGLKCQYGEFGIIEHLDTLITDGWSIIIAYSVDVPHFSIYSGSNGNHLFLKDPYFGERVPHLISKFVRSHWLVDISLYKVAIAEMDLKLDSSLNTTRWWVAYKK